MSEKLYRNKMSLFKNYLSSII